MLLLILPLSVHSPFLFFKKKIDRRYIYSYNLFCCVNNTYADMAEWQTHKTQNLAEVTSCGFKSHYPHSKSPVKSRGLTIRDIYFSYYFCYYVFVRSRCFFFYTKSTNRRFYFLPLVLNFHQSRFFL